MNAGLANSFAFDAADPGKSLAALPEAPGIFALCAADPAAEPYLGKTTNLRRRLVRFLKGASAASGTRRLQLAHLVHLIEFTATGSEFESLLRLYEASWRVFGERARKRFRLRPPAFLRMSVENAYPRVYATSRISKSAANALFGPFPSRVAAERFAEEMLNLFLLRRCFEELHPEPTFPGCVYSEMKMCLAPCFQGCTDERYQQEAKAVFDFLSTRGESLLKRVAAERDAASEAMEFEQAATLHQRMQKIQGVAQLAGEAVRPLAQLNGILVQPAADPEHVALFQLSRGIWSGPAAYSTLGMRLANERSGSSSLFAQPFALQAVPLDGAPSIAAKDILEARLEEAFLSLSQGAAKSANAQTLSDHVSLFVRWFYRPADKTTGEFLFAAEDGKVPHKPLLRAISRVAAKAVSANPAELGKPPIQWHA